ncbi:MAG: DEAD/DEAH box helicase family protein [Planctomycetaceae bacterium]|jgi:type III restriction enzyme|nr:DEAD/DEAH box helicase family protein [Planctomycetaceae bacterium]
MLKRFAYYPFLRYDFTMRLKNYQIETLDILSDFGTKIRESSIADAFHGITGKNYLTTPLPKETPYFCLRVPTGGGKTLLAAYSIGTVAKQLGHRDEPVVLWIAPSTTIVNQTLNALKNPQHPYRQALQDGLNGIDIQVMTMDDALSAGRSRYSGSAVIIVATLQSYRIDIAEGRKVYEQNGSLMNHFSDLPPEVREKLAEPEGHIITSFANVMRLYRPLVIMDEAHNARTPISFDSLKRFAPMAVLEWTATPQLEHNPDKNLYASNILHNVSALQLHNEGMIKFPIELESRSDWQDVLALMIQKRNELEEQAKKLKRYIRPIALLQAQPKNKTKETLTVEVLQKTLVEKLNIPPEYIRIATGNKDDLGSEDLRNENCPVRYIITVEKLREGWDCPFAYVLGSVGNVATDTAVEQLLGRIMRMPDAEPTDSESLNKAYTIVHCQHIAEVARNLKDGLVSSCGFDRHSANEALEVHITDGGLFSQMPITEISLIKPINLSSLPLATRNKLNYDKQHKVLQVKESLTREEHQALREMTPPEDRAAIEENWQRQFKTQTGMDDYAEPLIVPQMIVEAGKRKVLFEPIELDHFDWDLQNYGVALRADEFNGNLQIGERTSIGFNADGGVKDDNFQQVGLDELFFWDKDDWTVAELARWLDNEVHHGGELAYLDKLSSFNWLNRFVNERLKHWNMKILARKRHQLARLAKTMLINRGFDCMKAASEKLFHTQEIITTADNGFACVLKEQEYQPPRLFDASFEFKHHAFRKIYIMNDEEHDCAKYIESNQNVKRWLRNVEHTGFSLPRYTTKYRFYPDFLAELNDGRIAAVEYKGGHLDEPDKEEIGDHWAAVSGGKCVFVWVKDKNWNALEKLNS